ncbi:MAG TPA: phosphotransferase family protein [Woeseiaceae bacterium]|nr:phosphotransferase family protein [Woeseiaceae bacterium]
MTSRQAENSGTGAVRAGLEIDEARLADWLRSRIEGFRGPLRVSQFRGGQSNPTYLLETAAKRYVLRRKPPGPLLSSAHAVDREFRIISALHAAGFPVPRPFALCSDEAVTGTTFFVMAYVEGRIFWELDLPGLHPDERAAIYDDVNRTIARLHTIDYEALGLGDFGRPGNYFARQVSRWTKQYRASESHRIEAMERLIAWLPGNIPADDSTSIVHGDFRLDNLIVHPDEPRVIAVLDWELSTLGHPLADFTYHLLPWQMPEIGIGSLGLCDRDLAALGIPGEEDYVARYCERTGRAGIPHRGFYAAFNLFRLAGILQGISGRVRDGTAASAHARRAALSVEPLAALGAAAAGLG